MSDTNEKLAAELADALRSVAAMVEATPDLAPIIESAVSRMNGFVGFGYDDTSAALAMFARAALRHGAKVTKNSDDQYYRVFATWGPVTAYAYATRGQVCERVQVGEKTVTTTVPDPNVEIPMVEVTETVPVYEYRCSPLLAAGGAS
jgi:hypothetical protein